MMLLGRLDYKMDYIFKTKTPQILKVPFKVFLTTRTT